jgi:hypothetical protein
MLLAFSGMVDQPDAQGQVTKHPKKGTGDSNGNRASQKILDRHVPILKTE